MRYALNLDKDGRVLSAAPERFAAEGQPLVDALPDGDITGYLYIDGGYVYDPPAAVPADSIPTPLDRIEAQLIYTAMMTDTLLEV